MTAAAIVDHERATRKQLARIIDASNHMYLAGVLSSAGRALEHVRATLVQVALVEAELPDMEGARCVYELLKANPDLSILIYSRTTAEETILQCLKAGALGYLTKDIFPTRLLDAIREVVAGGSPMVPDVARKVVKSFQREQLPAWPKFSEREYEVLTLLCKGLSYREIGAQLFVSPNTVRFHLKNIYRKMKVNSRHEAVAKASRAGMV